MKILGCMIEGTGNIAWLSNMSGCTHWTSFICFEFETDLKYRLLSTGLLGKCQCYFQLITFLHFLWFTIRNISKNDYKSIFID